MKFHIIGKEGNIGSAFYLQIKENYIDNITDSDILVLCVNSIVAKEYIELYSESKIILNFSSYKPIQKNVINNLGCSTLSVLLPLLQIEKELIYIKEPINIVTLFPQNALSSKSKYKFKEDNIPIHTLSHNHQFELEGILKKDINMSHFITPADKNITSNIFISFSKRINLFNLIEGNFILSTKDYMNWNIISTIDNIMEPINYILKKLNKHIKEL